MILSTGEQHTVTLTNGSAAESFTATGDSVLNAGNSATTTVYRSTFNWNPGGMSASSSGLYSKAKYLSPYNSSSTTTGIGEMSLPVPTGTPAYDGSNCSTSLIQYPVRPITGWSAIASYALVSAPVQNATTLPDLTAAWTGATSTNWTMVLSTGEQHRVGLTNGSTTVTLESAGDKVSNAGNTSAVQTYMWSTPAPFGSASGDVLSGSYTYGGNFYITGGTWYDNNYTTGDLGWIVRANPNSLGSWGVVNTVEGEPNTEYSRRFAGQLGLVPSAWQPYLGGPLFVSSGHGLSVLGNNTPMGPNFATFDPANVTGGAAVPLNDLLDYFYQGIGQTSAYPQQLAQRSMSGPLGGTGPTYTLASAPTAGATTATLATTFSAPYTASNSGYFQVTFSDGETRVVHLQSGQAAMPYAYPGSNDPASFAALTCSPSCTTSVQIAPMGDNWDALYTGPFATPIFIPGTRTLAILNIQQYGPHSDPPAGCSINAGGSGTNDHPVGTDTTPYIRFQVLYYDLDTILTAANNYDPSPYDWGEFPGDAALKDASGCVAFDSEGLGSGAYDPTTGRLYIIFGQGTSGVNSTTGHMIVDVWQVNAP